MITHSINLNVCFVVRLTDSRWNSVTRRFKTKTHRNGLKDSKMHEQGRRGDKSRILGHNLAEDNTDKPETHWVHNWCWSCEHKD